MNTYEVLVNGMSPYKAIAETPSKAKYNCFRYISDIWDITFGQFLKEVLSCRKIGSFRPSDLFGDRERFERMKKARGIEFAYMGMRIEVCGKMGTIVGANDSLNLNVLYDGWYIHDNCHPWYRTKYFDNNGNVIAEYGE